MNIIVGFVCLVAVTVLKGVTGIPDPESNAPLPYAAPQAPLTYAHTPLGYAHAPLIGQPQQCVPEPQICMSESYLQKSADVDDSDLAEIAEITTNVDLKCKTKAAWTSAVTSCALDNINFACIRSIRRCVAKIVVCVLRLCI